MKSPCAAPRHRHDHVPRRAVAIVCESRVRTCKPYAGHCSGEGSTKNLQTAAGAVSRLVCVCRFFVDLPLLVSACVFIGRSWGLFHSATRRVGLTLALLDYAIYLYPGEIDERFGAYFETERIVGQVDYACWPPGCAVYLMARKAADDQEAWHCAMNWLWPRCRAARMTRTA